MPSFVISNVGTAALVDVATGDVVADFSKLDSIDITIDSAMTEVYGGTAAYPMVNILKDRKPLVDLKGPELNLGAYYRVLGATNTAGASGSPVQIFVAEDYVIPASGSLTLDHTPSTVKTNMTVKGIIDDQQFTSVASAPTAGQYSITGNTLTFDTSDAGTSVRVFYYYDSVSGSKFDVSSAAIPGVYQFIATAKYLQNVNDPAKTAYDIVFSARSTQLIGTLKVSMQRQQATAQSLQLNILDPGDGYDPVEISTSATYQ